MTTIERRSVYSGPVRRSLERGERITLDHTNQIKGINDQVGSVEEQVEVLESQIVTLQSQISGLSSSVGTLQGQVSTLQGQVGTLTTTVGGLQTQVNNQATAINDRAMGQMIKIGLTFAGDVAPGVGAILASGLNHTLVNGHRYGITLFLSMVYGGAFEATLYSGDSSTGAGVWMSGGGQWGSSHAEWFVNGAGSDPQWNVRVSALDGTPHINGTVMSSFHLEHLGPSR